MIIENVGMRMVSISKAKIILISCNTKKETIDNTIIWNRMAINKCIDNEIKKLFGHVSRCCKQLHTNLQKRILRGKLFLIIVGKLVS